MKLRACHVDNFPPTYENHMTFQGYKYTGSLHLAISMHWSDPKVEVLTWSLW